MLKDKIIAIIGTGNMGEALVSGLIGSKSSKPKNIICTDISQDKLRSVKANYKVRTTTNNLKAVDEADIVIYSVKPQIMAAIEMTSLDISSLVAVSVKVAAMICGLTE